MIVSETQNKKIKQTAQKQKKSMGKIKNKRKN